MGPERLISSSHIIKKKATFGDKSANGSLFNSATLLLPPNFEKNKDISKGVVEN